MNRGMCDKSLHAVQATADEPQLPSVVSRSTEINGIVSAHGIISVADSIFFVGAFCVEPRVGSDGPS
jgi:hypothetical protein